MLLIKKVFNNNVLSAVEKSGEEVILVGSGLGYQAKRGQQVDMSKVEKQFRLTGNNTDGTSQVLVSLPYEILALTGAISSHLRTAHGMELPPAVEIGLADHLHQSVKRLDEGIALYNSMLWETKATYPQEFTIALQILDLVDARIQRRLPVDEAGFITMHLVNAGLVTDAGHAYTLGRAMRDILDIVEARLKIPATDNSAGIARFLIHLKFVIRRLTQRRLHSGGFTELFHQRRVEDPEGYACARAIGDYLHTTFSSEITDEELMYLMVHLSRLRADLAAQAAGDDRAMHPPLPG